jgi:error-prone DNA polymerase
MGFYAPHTLVQDARRHGVEVRTPDLNQSAATATLESDERLATQARRMGADRPQVRVRRGGGGAGGVGEARTGGAARHLVRAGDRARPGDRDRRRGGPTPTRRTWRAACRSRCRSWRRWPPPAPSTASGCQRREAIWAAGAVAQAGVDRHGAQRLPGIVTGPERSDAAGHDRDEWARADLWATGREPRGPPHPLHPRAPRLARGRHRRRAGGRRARGSGCWWAASSPTGQRPATAGGTLFVNLEDETGPHQRGGVEGLLDRLPPGGSQRAGHARARPARAIGGRHQRHRRPSRGPPPRRAHQSRDFR